MIFKSQKEHLVGHDRTFLPLPFRLSAGFADIPLYYFGWHFALSHTSGGEWRSDICPFLILPPPLLDSQWASKLWDQDGLLGLERLIFFFSHHILKHLKQYSYSVLCIFYTRRSSMIPLIKTCLCSVYKLHFRIFAGLLLIN